MPSEDHIKSVIESYAAAHCRRDSEAIGKLFAPDAVVTDPVNEPSHVGNEDIVKFFASTHKMGDSLELQITGPIRVVSNYGAVPLRAITSVGSDRFAIDIIDIFTFNSDGLVSDMKAYWSTSQLKPLSAEDD